MERRKFLFNGLGLVAGGLALSSGMPINRNWIRVGQSKFLHKLPLNDAHYKGSCGYVEDDPVSEYSWASDESYERFLDLKFGIRVHWGPYSILQLSNESWPFLTMSFGERQMYQNLYKSWYPDKFDADEWVTFFKDCGAKMFSFTTKHHDGFSMYNTQVRVKKRVNWLADGGPKIEDCDLAYSIMESPFGRDVVGELADAALREKLKIDLYFSHPDWYDADFRPYNFHPLQVPGAGKLAVRGKDMHPELDQPENRFGKSGLVTVPQTTSVEIDRMMMRHRSQLTELITKYGQIDMVCLDMFLGPQVWPALRETMLYLRRLRPDVMYRARGIGNYGDYYTPEGFVPGSKENTDVPWFVIYPLGGTFSYEGNAGKYKGTSWTIRNLVDSAAKGGNFMVGIGPDGSGEFHPEAVKQLKGVGEWLRVNGTGIYGTRPRKGEFWKQGKDIRFTQSKNGDKVFVFCYHWPGKELILHSLRPPEEAKIQMFGTTENLTWRFDEGKGLVITLPERLNAGLSKALRSCYGFKIILQS